MPALPTVPRRTFLKMTAAAAATLTRPMDALAPKTVFLVADPEDPVASSGPAKWAAGYLQSALSQRGLDVRMVSATGETKGAARVVIVSGAGPAPHNFPAATDVLKHPESLRVVQGHVNGAAAVLVASPGALGLVYGLTDLADRVRTGVDPLQALDVSTPAENPANEVRSVARAFCSEVEDKPWFYSKDFWSSYLDAVVASRFNRFNFAFGFGYDFPKGVTEDYFHFPYPYLVTVPGYDVHVEPLAPGERERNMEMFRYIVAETALRGLQFQLGIWTHAYEWTDSPKSYHHIVGLTPQNHANYSRDALAILLKECPQITGVTLRVHGESGVPEGSYDFWRTLFDAIKNCGRTVEIDMHAKGINQIMIDMGNDTGMPIKIGAKSWAEHMGLGYHQADIRELEIPTPGRMETGVFAVSNGERRFTRYGYADLLQEGRKYNVLFRIWPGTQRHLLWGDPEMAAAYSRTAHFCGAAGLEFCEPLTFKGREGSGHPGGRCDYIDASLEPKYDWEKFAYTYRLWGRMLYNPDTAPEVWQRSLKQQFGAGAAGAEAAMANASRILPLITSAHLPSASNHSFWPEMYGNMPITTGLRSPYNDTPKPFRFGTVSPLDPQLFSSIEEFVREDLAGMPGPKYSPLSVATWLETFTSASAAGLEMFRRSASRRTSPEARRWEEDTLIQIELGRFFAAKLRGGVAYEVFLATGDPLAGDTALAKYMQAREAWATMAQRAAEIYKADVDYGEIRLRRGHWLDRLPAIDEDLAAMKTAVKTPAAQVKKPGTEHLLAQSGEPAARMKVAIQHTAPASFKPGQAFPLKLNAGGEITAVDLMYRHVNQGERWKSEPMEKQGTGFAASIPSDYTQSVYPLQYYFVVRRGNKSAFHPEFNAQLSNEPYYSVWRRG